MIQAVPLKVVCLAVLGLTSEAEAAVIRSPLTVIRNDYWRIRYCFYYRKHDQSGRFRRPVSTFVSGVDDYATYVARNPAPMHFSNNGSSNLAWFGVATASFFRVHRLRSWSRALDRAVSFLLQSAQGLYSRFSVQTSNDSNFSSSSTVGSFTPFYNNDGNSLAPLQDIELVDTAARYVRFDISGFHSALPGMGEVAFATSTVPEPSSSLACQAFGTVDISPTKAT